MKKTNVLRKISWKRILIFFVIATILSNIFRFDLLEVESLFKELPPWILILSTVILEGCGVFIGALIALFLLKKKRKTMMTFFGTSKSKSFLMAIIPIIILTVIGVKNEFRIDSHLYGLIAIMSSLIYCIMEEYGWRGYLQEELKALTAYQKYLIIGFIWYLWHLTFLTAASLGDNLFFLSMMIFGSWGIGQVAEATKSILASACFHLIIQIMMFNALIKNGIDGIEKLVILGVSVILWFIIIKKWERGNTISEKKYSL